MGALTTSCGYALEIPGSVYLEDGHKHLPPAYGIGLTITCLDRYLSRRTTRVGPIFQRLIGAQLPLRARTRPRRPLFLAPLLSVYNILVTGMG